MKISAGILITDGENILLGHSTNNSWWDLPKGLVEKDESVIDTAIRETCEEFGLDYSASPLIDLGEHGYTKTKRLHLFKAVVDEMPNPSFCDCTSYFELYGKMIPEIDGYDVFPVDVALTKMNKSMKRVVEKFV